MEVQSPPKRMTRARAAAKATSGDATSKPTKVVTASAKATATTTRTTSSMKRKARPDDLGDHEEPTSTTDIMNKPPARTRGRPKKVVEPQPEPEPEPEQAAPTEEAPAPAPKATRGRPKKIATEAPKIEPGKNTRARATRKTRSEEENGEPVKKTTRGRAASNAAKDGAICTTVNTNPTPGLKSAVSRPAFRTAAVKKSVTFQEPQRENKENLLPPAAVKAKTKTTDSTTTTATATGMRARPIRKPAAGGRMTRASARTRTTSNDKNEKPAPLSPKKDSQNRPLSRQSSSDDELAIDEKTPLKPLMKSPVKPPSSTRKLDLGVPATQEPVEEEVEEPSEPTGVSVFGSPARRPPSSPWKDAMKSPAKRVDAIPSLILSAHKQSTETTQSPFKTSMLQSPAKRPQVPIQGLQAPSHELSDQRRSPLKMSLLNSPAKRPMSPLKPLGTMIRPAEDQVEEPENAGKPECEAGEELPTEEAVETASAMEEEMPERAEAVVENVVMTEDYDGDAMTDDVNEAQVLQLESPSQLEFPGRLSAVLARSADPALREKTSPVKAATDAVSNESRPAEPEASVEESAEDPMDIDEDQEEDAGARSPETTPPRSIIRPKNPFFGLREKDLTTSINYDSEDELASSGKGLSTFQDDNTQSFNAVPATPTPANSKTPRNELPSSAIKAASRAIRSVSRGSKLGYTPLARQLNEWKAGSPSKLGHESPLGNAQITEEDISLVQASPAKYTFFDDEMKVRDDMEADEAALVAAMEADIAANYDDPEFDDIALTNEDVQLAAEANEMSLLEPEQIDEMLDLQNHDGSISEASQEYGDENAIPIDPTLLTQASRSSMAAVPPVTPIRHSAPRPFNTTTKVPLKPADDSTPRIKKRSASVSKPPPNRPTGPIRNATVISYSPTKEFSNLDIDQHDEAEENQNPPVTPSKSDIWSSMGTPARTPRRDLNPALLRGAVVFVDVHTSEGADASTVFIELLTQMGARCVKSWPWNPISAANTDYSASKIGITHVVFKDGGKRTMEKVRESGGVVQCVGVGWVLDCERENEWLEEAPYYIDTTMVPRGGARRRKSMEPKALANLNGTLVTPMKQTAGPPRECQTVPNNHVSRRESTAWIRTPSDRDDDDENMDAAGEDDWDAVGVLTPVPKTPAPESIRQFAMDVTPETPAATSVGDDSFEQDQFLMRTAPPKQSIYADLGEGLLRQDKDQNVVMRLMAARRKSLQFAPKIASPLSKAWN
ncbi:uncharacterized protein BCR38DRAFT_478378 [Pseudomassariella vexata]|uniref:BRCT domain-containing protein n=1 Tax=Pseudomassariella vexata TaxID=1141098 RepID=A0A1Y2DD26_9PEZI|nr:uncharacterized protein BCR38DRAFT_478378 [Pseudomassariella vexata]ORY57183.1 hypothetical protein BCR38DRAFT_478378 [Pseudomassariella vexata]